MKNIKKWTQPEFKAYLVFNPANANFFESKDETDIVQKIVSTTNYEMIHRELEKTMIITKSSKKFFTTLRSLIIRKMN